MNKLTDEQAQALIHDNAILKEAVETIRQRTEETLSNDEDIDSLTGTVMSIYMLTSTLNVDENHYE